MKSTSRSSGFILPGTAPMTPLPSRLSPLRRHLPATADHGIGHESTAAALRQKGHCGHIALLGAGKRAPARPRAAPVTPATQTPRWTPRRARAWAALQLAGLLA